MRKSSALRDAVWRFTKTTTSDVNVLDINHPLQDGKLLYIHPRIAYQSDNEKVYASYARGNTGNIGMNAVWEVPLFIDEQRRLSSNVETAFIDACAYYDEHSLRSYYADGLHFYAKQGLIVRDDLTVACIVEHLYSNLNNRTVGKSITFDTGVLRYPNMGIHRFFTRKLIPYLMTMEWLERGHIGIAFANLSGTVVNKEVNHYVSKEDIVALADIFFNPQAQPNLMPY